MQYPAWGTPVSSGRSSKRRGPNKVMAFPTNGIMVTESTDLLSCWNFRTVFESWISSWADLTRFFCIPWKWRSLDLVTRGKSCQSSRLTLGTHMRLQFLGNLYLSWSSLNFVSSGFLEGTSFTHRAIASATSGPNFSVSSNIEDKNSLDSSVFELMSGPASQSWAIRSSAGSNWDDTGELCTDSVEWLGFESFRIRSCIALRVLWMSPIPSLSLSWSISMSKGVNNNSWFKWNRIAGSAFLQWVLWPRHLL